MAHLRRLGLDDGIDAYANDQEIPGGLQIPQTVECLAVGHDVRLSELLDTNPHLAGGLTELRAFSDECRGDVLRRLCALKKLVIWSTPHHQNSNTDSRTGLRLGKLANITTLILDGGTVNLKDPLPPTLRTLCLLEGTVTPHALMMLNKCVPRGCRVCLDGSTVKGFSALHLSQINLIECPSDCSAIKNGTSVLTVYPWELY